MQQRPLQAINTKPYQAYFSVFYRLQIQPETEKTWFECEDGQGKEYAHQRSPYLPFSPYLRLPEVIWVNLSPRSH